MLSPLLFGAEGTLGYVSVLDSLEPRVVDPDQAREFSGTADVWVHDGFVYVTNDESFTITKFSVEGGAPLLVVRSGDGQRQPDRGNRLERGRTVLVRHRPEDVHAGR